MSDSGDTFQTNAVAILGTGSDVGKSLVTAGLCRLLYRRGLKVAPFKAQNMSLNSFVTLEGGEMGRAQVLQAEACGIQPHVDMNPILLKPQTDQQSQVIVHGAVWRTQEAKEYFGNKAALFELVKASYDRLAEQYEVIVIEGAGSAAEMNLRDRDIVNWPVVEMADAVVVLVADIDRGGVFAQVIGTMNLLAPHERERVIGIIINKFRGDTTLFEDGVKMIEARTGVPVLGVLPYLRNLELDQEDSVDVDRFQLTPFSSTTINVAVLLLPHMSNFTDFNQLAAESDLALRYVRTPKELDEADVVIIPGTKTTIADLEYLKTEGFESAVKRQLLHGAEVVGICGGFQMLGARIADPQGAEGGGEINGLGLLEMQTTLLSEKKTVQVHARPLFHDSFSDCLITGYEIHMGRTEMKHLQPCFQILSQSTTVFDGACHENGTVWGTYIHGVFDQPGFRRKWLNQVRERKGLGSVDLSVSEAVSQRLANTQDQWADHVAKHVNMEPIISSFRLT